MKELSIEEKAKRYDELLLKLQKAKVDDNVCDEMYYRVIDDIVPELKESEDEGIRKFLIDFIKVCGWSEKQFPHREDCVAWLEKQGEQKPTLSEEDEGILDEIIDFLENGTVKLQHDLSLYASWLKSIRPQNTWKPSDEQMDALEYHLKHTNENSRLYKETKKLYEQLKKLK